MLAEPGDGSVASVAGGVRGSAGPIRWPLIGCDGVSAPARRIARLNLTSAVTRTLTRGEDVTIPGFGKFSTVYRAARTGRNPATGAELEIKAATAPKFSAGSGLKAAVNANNN